MKPQLQGAACDTLRQQCIAVKEFTSDIANDGIGIDANECVVVVSKLEDCTKANANDNITTLLMITSPHCNFPVVATQCHTCSCQFQCRCLQNVDTFVTILKYHCRCCLLPMAPSQVFHAATAVKCNADTYHHCS